MRLFDLEVPDKTTDLERHYTLYGQLLNQLELKGLNFLEPYDVAGYDAYFQVPDFQRYWISSNYLANRYKFAEFLINGFTRSEEHTSELQSRPHLVCRLLLEKK